MQLVALAERLLRVLLAGSALLMVGCSTSEPPIDTQRLNRAELIYEAALGNPGDSSDELVEFLVEGEERRESQLRDCMSEDGFSYIPFTPTETSVPEGLPGSREFAQSHGFGIVSGFLGEFESEVGASEAFDPNADYVNSLSNDEQDRYREQLYGVGGCMDQVDEASGVVDEIIASYEDQLIAQIIELYEQPEYIFALDRQDECMTSNGFEGFSASGLREDVSLRLSELGPEIDASSVELRQLRSDEIAAALAVHDCEEQFRAETDKLFDDSAGRFDALYRSEIVGLIYDAIGDG